MIGIRDVGALPAGDLAVEKNRGFPQRKASLGHQHHLSPRGPSMAAAGPTWSVVART
jgi:hypothetical protein